MLSVKQLHGARIIETDGGSQLGTADLVVFSPERRALVAFVMNNGDVLTKNQQFVAAEDVSRLEPDVISVKSADVLHQLDQAPSPLQDAADSSRRLIGTDVVTENGDTIGELQDFFVEPPSPAVTSMAVKIDDTGTTEMIAIDRLRAVGRDAVVVASEASS